MGENGQATFEQLCAFAEARMKEKGVPGVAVGVLHEGTTYTAGFGVTSVDNPLPVTDETLFQIGSIGKTFTCLAMMRLVEAGQLDLQATVRTYVPDFEVADETVSAQVTLWHLLTHTSGWDGDLFEDTGAGEDAMARYVAKMADQEQIAPLGMVWSYNNSGFYLAGHVIEQVTGKSYEAAMQELVFEPLGLERCYFSPAEVITQRFAVGHEISGSHAHVARPWALPRAAYAAGGIVCDVKELLRYAQFQMGDGSVSAKQERGEDGGAQERAEDRAGERVQVLRQESMAAMHSPQAVIREDGRHVGLSWMIRDIEGTRQLGHGGGTVGQVTLLAIYPDHGLAVAVLTNADEGGSVADDIRDWVVERYLGIKEAEPAPIEATEEELAAYAGFYARPFDQIELGMLCGQLVGQMVHKRGFPSQDVPPPPPPPPVSLKLCGQDRLLASAGPGKKAEVDILRKADGTIGWLRMGGRIRKKT